MKKHGFLAIILIVALAFTLAACDGTFSTPRDVAMSGNTLTWSPVKDAEKYGVSIDGGDDIIVTNTFYTYADASLGEHTLKVRAYNKSGETTQYSQEVKYIETSKVATPVVRVTVGESSVDFTWDAVENASGYGALFGLDLNSENEVKITDGTFYSVKLSTLEKEGVYKFQVRAFSGNELYANSPYSAVTTYTKTKKLSAPTDITVSSSSLSWKSVENASSYKVTAVIGEETLTKTTTATSISYSTLGITKAGDYAITVTASNPDKSNVYLESDPSESKTVKKLPAPTNFRLEGDKLLWDGVTDNNGYQISANTTASSGRSFVIAVDKDKTEYDLSADKTIGDDNYIGLIFTFSIFAKGNSADNILEGVTVNVNDGAYYSKDKEPEKFAEGEYNGYYKIESAAHLAYMRNHPDANYVLTKDIDMGKTCWLPVNGVFTGKFIGNGNIISNITMNNSLKLGSEHRGYSLFNEIGAGGEVKGLVLTSVAIDIKAVKAEGETAVKGNSAAGIAIVNNGTIEDVVVMGIVKAYDNANSGGIAVENNGTIKASATDANIYGRVTGGIAAVNGANAVIDSSASYGNIDGVGTVAGDALAGGIVGRNAGAIISSWAIGTVQVNIAKDATGAYAGGLVGKNDGSVSNSYATGKVNIIAVQQNDAAAGYVGGFVGANTGKIKNSYTNSSDVARGDSTSYLGGFVGSNDGEISNCLSNAKLENKLGGRKGGFSAKNGGVITDCIFNTTNAKLEVFNGDGSGTVSPSSKGVVNDTVKGEETLATLGSAFAYYNRSSISYPQLKDMIYFDNAFQEIGKGVKPDKYLSDYYAGGEKKSDISKTISEEEMKITGYKIVKYTHSNEASGVTVVYNRIVRVK